MHTHAHTHIETYAWHTHSAHTLMYTYSQKKKRRRTLPIKHAQVVFFKMSATHDARLREIDGLGAKPTKDADSQRAVRATKRSKVIRGSIKENQKRLRINRGSSSNK